VSETSGLTLFPLDHNPQDETDDNAKDDARSSRLRVWRRIVLLPRVRIPNK